MLVWMPGVTRELAWLVCRKEKQYAHIKDRRFDEKRREKELVAFFFGLRISLSTMKEGNVYVVKQTKEEKKKMNTI